MQHSLAQLRGPAAASSAAARTHRRPAASRALTTRALLVSTTAAQTQKSVSELKKLSLVTAIKTPYLPNGKFDLASYDNLLDLQIQNGVEGVIVGGTTGEGHLMTWDEHIMLIAHTVNSFGSRVKVIGNTGSNSTREAVHATEQGFAVGMHAALQINPYYGKTSTTGLLTHFRTVLGEGPGIVYNVPSRTSQDIPDDVILQLAQHPNFLGVKECTGNPRIAAYVERGVNCWSGNDDEAHAAKHQAGAAGVISVTSNLVPGLFSQMFREGPNPEISDSLQVRTRHQLLCAACGRMFPPQRLPSSLLHSFGCVDAAWYMFPARDRRASTGLQSQLTLVRRGQKELQMGAVCGVLCAA
jgi:4-hydroxy-tetrahydrodipicolinate synthase